ncbi:hypothetical protein ABIB62_002307 [Mucilaginibacter sp. UYP25]
MLTLQEGILLILGFGATLFICVLIEHFRKGTKSDAF